MTFGQAIESLKQGEKVCRRGWNGKNMWLKLVNRGYFDVGCSIVENNNVELSPWIGMKTSDNRFAPWLASQTDLLTEDWQVLD